MPVYNVAGRKAVVHSSSYGPAGKWMLILRQPFEMPDSRAEIYEMEETADGFEVLHSRVDLHG